MKYSMADIKSETPVVNTPTEVSNNGSAEIKKQDKQTSKITSPAKKSSSPIIFVVIIFLLVGVVAAMSVILLMQNGDNLSEGILGLCKCSTSVATEDTTDTADADTVETDTAGEVTRISLGGENYIDIPAGWELTTMDVQYHGLSEAEKTDLEAYGNTIIGWWPVFDKAEFILENGDATFTIQMNSPFIPYIGGFYDSEFVASGYTVLRDATNDGTSEDVDSTNVGIARKDLSDNVWDYYTFYDSSVYEISGPVSTNHDLPGAPRFYYEGDVDLLDQADDMFTEYCVENTTGLCSY